MRRTIPRAIALIADNQNVAIFSSISTPTPASRARPARATARRRVRTFAPSARTSRALAPAVVDTLTIVVLAGVASATYGSQLGFYGTDWSFLERAASAAPAGPAWLVRAAFASGSNVSQSLAFLLFALQYAFFGACAAGYHHVMDALVAVSGVACYLVLRRAGVVRPLALAAGLVLAFSPVASGARFALATTAYLGLALYFGSFAAGLTVRGATPRRAFACALLALGTEYAAAFTSEITVPLFLGSAYVLSKRGWASRALGGAMAATALGAALLNAALGGDHHLVHAAVASAPSASTLPRSFFSTLGSLCPLDAWLALLAGGCAAAAVFRVALGTRLPGTGAALRFSACGLGALGLGYAVVVATTLDGGAAASDGASLGLATTLGVALTLVGAAATFASLFGRTRKQAGFLALAVGLACGGSSALLSGSAAEWRAAGRQQVRVVADMVDRTAGLPKGAVVLIGGACPSFGAGPSLATRADVTAAVRTVLGRADVRADVVSPATRVGRPGIVTNPRDDDARYPYGERTIGYDASTRAVVPLVDPAGARRFVSAAQRELADQCGA